MSPDLIDMVVTLICLIFSFSPFYQRFRVEFPSSDPTVYSEPISDRCTRALALCMDDLNFRITTVVTLLGRWESPVDTSLKIPDSSFRSWLSRRLHFTFLCLPRAFAYLVCLLALLVYMLYYLLCFYMLYYLPTFICLIYPLMLALFSASHV